MLQKWLLATGCVLCLAACSDDSDTTAEKDGPVTSFESVINDQTIDIAPVDTPNEDVQAVIDMTEATTFASFIYSMSDDSYLLINSADTIDVTADDTDTTLNVHITRNEPTAAESSMHVYAVSFTHPYDTIKLFEDGEEIPFDIWTE